MKKLIFVFVISVLCLNASSQNIEQEKEAIQKVIQTAYVEGLQNEGDTKKIDSGFHQHFHLLGISEGDEMWHLNINDWKSQQVKKREAGKLPLTGENKVSIKFQTIDITGTAAVAKIEFYIGTKLTYIDYISLYKFESGWKMVNKIFYKL
ncbi:nuclear transport factor 2 family protein [uncultured Draconibacterium sp.]|uniref:nuclear transport factor 2 family protein n=1 Tax=uncultured Draconibacterium sp. TaxID=1573823 RepID=UPI002AA72F1E|nr:nuclear transport factor 2 family protein [uncultured Draconibacterium sp.]